MIHRRAFAWSVLLVVLSTLLAWRAQALPAFARKYHVGCSTCHAPAVPRLNGVGFKFRRAGFRMPEQIGLEEQAEFALGDYFAAVVQTQYEVTHTSDRTLGPAVSQTNNTFSLPELQLHPLTGSLARYFATRAQITFSADEGVAVENGYIRGVWGTQDAWFEARAGLFHPFEGFGAADLPIGLSAPLFMVQSANMNQDTLYRIGDINRVGAEVGVQWLDTSLSVMVENTLTATVSGGEVAGEGTIRDTDNRKNIVVVANQLVGNYSGVTAYYAHGWTNLPTDPDAFVAGTLADTWRNRFDRLALFGSLGNGRVYGYAGGALGFDHALDRVTGQTSIFHSVGAFVEGDMALTPWAIPYLRGDYFDPSTETSDNQTWAVTAGVGLYAEWVWLIPELTWQNTAGVLGHRDDTGGFLRALAAF